MERFITSIYNKLSSNKVLLVILIITFVFIYMFNRIYPLMIDDWMYTFIFGQNPPVRVSSFNDILVSQYNHYMQWGEDELLFTSLRKY